MLLSLAPWSAPIVRGNQRPSAFSCGPHALTYLSIPNDDDPTSGVLGVQVRCVIVNDNAPLSEQPSVPQIVWYGEGWDGNPTNTNRHLGAAFALSGPDLTGYAADISGNGAARDESFDGNIHIHVVHGDWPAPTVLAVTADCGCFHDRWTLVQSIPYAPLPRPTACAGKSDTSYFEQYAVSYVAHVGSGLRCVYRFGKSISGWLGNGTMDGVSYTQVGYRTQHGYAAADLCGDVFGARCQAFPAGSIKLMAQRAKTGTSGSGQPPKRIRVTATFSGAGESWTERWIEK
jgi:hypothetical protein